MNLYQNDWYADFNHTGRERNGEREGEVAHDPKHATLSVKHGGDIFMACMTVSGISVYLLCDC